MTDVRKLLADALVQAAMEDDKSQKVTVTMRVLEIMVGHDLRTVTMKDLEDFAEHASLCADGMARSAGVRPASFDDDLLSATTVEARAGRLRAARKLRYRNASDLARRVGRLPVTVRAHENAQNGYQIDMAETYAKALGVTTEWLLFGRGEGPVSAPSSGQPQSLTG